MKDTIKRAIVPAFCLMLGAGSMLANAQPTHSAHMQHHGDQLDQNLGEHQNYRMHHMQHRRSIDRQGALFQFKHDGDELMIRCESNESTEECAKTAVMLLEKLYGVGSAEEEESQPETTPTPPMPPTSTPQSQSPQTQSPSGQTPDESTPAPDTTPNDQNQQ